MSRFRSDAMGPSLRSPAAPTGGYGGYGEPDGYREYDGYDDLDGYREYDAGADEFADFDAAGPTTRLRAVPRLDGSPEFAPFSRPAGRAARLREMWRSETPLTRYAVMIGVPLVLVLIVANLLVGSPGAQNGQAQQQNAAGMTNGTGTATGTTTGGTTATDNTGGTAAGTGTTPGTTNAAGGTSVTPTLYEAEDTTHNTLGPTTKVRDAAGASGGKVVTSIGHGTPAGDVTFNTVTAQAAGKYTLVIYYLLADTTAHRLALWVNGKGPAILNFPPLGADGKVGMLRTTVTLNAGTNTVRFSNATMKYGPDLDRISLVGQQ